MDALKDFAECFISVGFDSSSALGDLIFKTYLNVSKEDGFADTPDGVACRRMFDLEGCDEDTVGSVCESILSYSISFAYCLLENPGIWGDIPDGEDNNTSAQFVETTIFAPEKVKSMLQTLTMKYLMLTNDEVAAWQADSLAYFMDVKSESNVTKGNYLREKANRLVAGFQLRFEPLFNDFCQNDVVRDKLSNPSAGFQPSGDASLVVQMQKDAMLQLIKQRLAMQDDENINAVGLLGMIDAELQQQK